MELKHGIGVAFHFRCPLHIVVWQGNKRMHMYNCCWKKKGTVSSLLEESCYIFIVGEWGLYRGEGLRYMIMGENANQLSHLLGNNPSFPPPPPHYRMMAIRCAF